MPLPAAKYVTILSGSLVRIGLKMMKYRLLGNTGLKLSIIGMGGSGYGNVYGKYDESAAIKGVHYALGCGVNYIDTAPWYGQGVSEKFLGKALHGVDRGKFFIGTKVGRYERDVHAMFDFSAARVVRGAEESLRRLDLEYVDILQVHDVEFAPSIDLLVNETIPALKSLQDRGLCRYIGITGYSLPSMKEILQTSEVSIDSILSYCRLTLNDSSLITELDFFEKMQVGVINASPVSMGLLAPASIQPWHPASNEIKQACSKAVEHCKENGVDISRIALHYSANFEKVATTLVSMVDENMFRQNCDSVLNPLSSKEIQIKDNMEEMFFKPLTLRHWEGVEVKEYWENMKEGKGSFKY